ncbi:MAG TPA: ABC transporter permease [Pseudolabrys sp.]|nr:ABC transporter permease [Pseudolabrys sp.]
MTGKSARRWLPVRFALRELRGGLRGFYVFIACIALGSMAIAGIGSLAASLAEGFARQGRVILGGDLAFTLTQREATQQEIAFLKSHGELSTVATMRAMARTPTGESSLVELKAVDSAYPLFGNVAADPQIGLVDALTERNGVFGALADPTLLARLQAGPGARVSVGTVNFEIRAALESEPDKLAGGIGFGPRFLVSEEALRATGLLQPGSLVRWHYRLRLPQNSASDENAKALTVQARKAFPQAGWDIRSSSNASPQLERNIDRFTQFLTIVGLTALLVGGVGVGNAVKSHLDRRRDTIATVKALGANGRTIVAVYLAQVLLLAAIGGAIGVAIGAVLPFAVAWMFGSFIPLPIVPSIHPEELLLAAIYGVLTALAFAIWPLGRAHDAPVGALFRDVVAPDAKRPRKRYVVLTAAAVIALATLAVLLAYDRRVALIFVGTAAVVFLTLRMVALLLIMLAERAPRAHSTELRMAVANVHRPGALTSTVVLSLGLGITLLVTVIEIDGNLRRQFSNELPARAPSFYFLDIPADRASDFRKFVTAQAPSANMEQVPMLRGRIIAAAGIPVEKLHPSEDAAWVLQSDRGITYSNTIPAGSRIVEGEWWREGYDGSPLVSFEKRIADGLGLKLGDSITVNVLGRNVTATIANLRTVDWESLGINFVMVFSPNSFRGAPHTHLATLALPGGGRPAQEAQILRAVSQSYPRVTTVRVKEALEAVGGLIGNLVLAIRGASAVTLVAAALVLGGALAAGHRHRVYDAVILKTLGATRWRLIAAYSLEYILIGSATAVFGTIAGSLAAWLIVAQLMHLSFTWIPPSAMIAALASVAVTVGLGLVGTFVALGQKPAPVLRNL